jgi:mRNA interferase YafQ
MPVKKGKGEKKSRSPTLESPSVDDRRLVPKVAEFGGARPPRIFDRTSAFKKDWDRLASSGRYDMSRLKTVMMHLIANEGPLPAEYADHALLGKWQDHRDCHVGGDWVLIYKLTAAEVIFVRTGTHSDLFK